MGERDNGFFIGHHPCIASEMKEAGINRWGKDSYEDCNSSDGNAIYETDTTEGEVSYSGFCWSCKQNFRAEHIAKSSLAEELGMDTTGVVTERKSFVRKEKQPPLDKKKVIELIKKIGYTKQTYRGIRPETLKFFGHLAEEDRNGDIKAIYYPETSGTAVTGYKIRYLPKFFGKVGKTGLSSDLAGQVKFKNYENHRDCLLVGGEVDLCSAYQMLRDNQLAKGQGDYAAVTVLSPTTGEGSAIKQVRSQYDFLNKYENIILALDNDTCGNEAMRQIAEILPREKVKIVKWTLGDPNTMLTAGKQKQFMSDFYNAKPLIASGILSSADVMEQVKEELLRPRIHLPPYMKELQKNMKGGLLQGRILNIIGDTSVNTLAVSHRNMSH